MVGLIKRTFSYIGKDNVIFLTLYKALVRPHLEYGNVIWYPLLNLKRQSASIERVQRRATKLLPECREKSYEDRLNYLRLPSLKARRERGDLIQAYKIFHQIEDIDFNSLFQLSKSEITRGNKGKMFVKFANTNLRKNSFAIRVVNKWNSLPTNIKLTDTLNSFKNLLDANILKKCRLDFDE